MNNPVVNLLATTNWLFVVVAIVCSVILGMVRYHPRVFGRLYATYMNMPTDIGADEKKKGMIRSMRWEILSRCLYFIGLGQALQIGGWTDLGNGLVFAVVVWAIFVLPTQMSQTARSGARMKVLWIVAGKALVETCVVTALRFLVF